MTIDDAVQLVCRKTGDYPISAFEFDGSYYVLMTPLEDYEPGIDVVHCYYPVQNGIVKEPINDLGLFLCSDDPYGMFEAAKHAKNYLRRTRDE